MLNHQQFRIAVGLLCLLLTRSFCAAEDVDQLPKGAFTFAVLPDTQAYVSEKTEATFSAEVDWILEHQKSQNIQFVSHVGDIVGDYNSEAQWVIARRHMIKLKGRVPFAFSVGNHDMLSSGDSALFQKTFPAEEFAAFDWYAGQIKNNANSYQLFSVDQYKFVWLHLECNAPDNVLEWANGVLTKHADRRALVTTHMFLGPRDHPMKPSDYYDAPKGVMRWHKTHGNKGNSPEQLWAKCFSHHVNLFLICCGDQSRTQTLVHSAKGKHGNVVHACLSDYRGGNFRLYRFLPAQNKIRVITFSASQKSVCRSTKIAPNAESHQFELPYDLSN
ncbi:MAG: serine/threonine protein phosphatase [Planctomycetaceae bacterium]|nr:serine/threonine protein phosphatase [Planctomycetaceae bacterium]